MSALTDYQTIVGSDGKPAYVVMPYDLFLSRFKQHHLTVPNDVVKLVFDKGLSPARAWREHLGLTQTEVARRMGVTQAAVAQVERPDSNPRRATLRKLAAALGLKASQLDF